MEWIKNLYQETKQKWEEAGSDPSCFAIFYSQVIENAKIALIGYNPGGNEKDFNVQNINSPEKHEYIDQNYKLARNVRKIFEYAKLEKVLEDSVKFNLIFFRSKVAKDFTNKDLINYSEKKAIEILDKLRPKIIIAEGFDTFTRIIQLKKGLLVEDIYLDKKMILRKGKLDNTFVLGIIHPSGARGISDAMLHKLAEEIKTVIDSL